MKCPACSTQLTEKKLEDLTVDACQGGCGGVWFDAHEFKKVDEAHEHRGEALLNIATNSSIKVDHEKRRHCPRCGTKGQSFLMMRRFSSVLRKVSVDECQNCAGIWLDLGELAQIRSEFKTEEERRTAALKQFSGLFDEQIKNEQKNRTTSASGGPKVSALFKLITPK